MTERVSAETKRMMEAVARRAAEAAVKRTLLTLGIDASSGDAIREAQQDFAFLRRTRVFTGVRSTKLVVIVFSTAMSVLGAAVTLLIQKAMGQ